MYKNLTFIAFFLFSCKGEVKKTENNPMNHRPFMEGCWIIQKYANAIKATKSPFEAMEYADAETGFNINFDEIEGDSLMIGFNLGNHEGNTLVLNFKNNQLPNCFELKMNDYENKGYHFSLGYEYTQKDTTMSLITLAKSNKIIKKEKYIRILKDKTDDLSAAINYLINKNIFEGKYTNAVTQEKVFFQSNGKTDFKGFSTYEVAADFVGPDQFDAIWFTNTSKERLDLGFKINKDTLLLYDFKMEWDSLNNENRALEYGNIKYKLIKK